MEQLPERPPTVPVGARWRVDLEKWETIASHPDGTGERLLHRADGSLYERAEHDGSTPHGPFTIFHPSGAVARQGNYFEGEVDGQLVARVDPGDGTTREDDVPLRTCCVPGPAVEMRATYRRGELQFETFFDTAGRLLMSDGRVYPDRPAALPERARLDETTSQWMVAPLPGEADDLHRFYDLEGTLREESRFAGGARLFTRRYTGAPATLVNEGHFRADGRREGHWYQRFGADESRYTDVRIGAESGDFTSDFPVGPWTFFDAAGAVVRTVDYGAAPLVPVDDPVFADETRDAAAWLADVDACLQRAQPALALCAAARAAARAGDLSDLLSLLAKHTVTLMPAAADQVAHQAAAATDEPLAVALAALLKGGDPAEALRALSALMRGLGRVSLDFAEAALLLAPDRPAMRFSRALARLEMGDDGGALADARLLDTSAPEIAQFLRDYLRVLFPVWEFWPAQERWDDPVDGVPDEPGQPLAEIQRVVQVYATRLALVRDALIARAPRRARAPWMPAVPAAALPDGPTELRQFETTITDETEDGPETIAVSIDETIDLSGRGVPALLMQARRQWAALTWLCWATGQAQVRVPREIATPPAFSAAAAAALSRYVRVLDTLQTGGLRSRNAGAPSFAFCGFDIDVCSGAVAEIAREETHELRALFLWLLSPENHSPFQSDLREG